MNAPVRLEVLDPHDESESGIARLRAWGNTLSRQFLDARPDDKHELFLLHFARTHDVRVLGAWPEQPADDTDLAPIGTFASWAGELTVAPGRRLPLHMITDVTVAPTHRRQGLLRRMMDDDLAHAVAAGRPVAALTVSEGGIYGRFGFGVATRLRQVGVDLGPRFALRDPALADAPGTLRLLDPVPAWPEVQRVFEAHRAVTRGAVTRPAHYEPMLTGTLDLATGQPNPKLRAVVHRAPDGTPDGYALYTPVGEVDGRQTIDVADVVGLTPAVYLRLWRLLADLDLIEHARWRRHPTAGPLEWALADRRAVRTTGLGDHLWLRILDVVAALEARGWGADGRVVLEVRDPQEFAAGRWEVDVADGTARVARTSAAADLALDAETLGALYLGDVATATLAASGRLTGSPDALRAWAAMADHGPAPYCSTAF